MIRDRASLQEIEDVVPPIHAPGTQRALLFRKIEQGDIPKRDVIEIKVAAKVERPLEEERQPTSKSPPRSERPGKPTQKAQLAKRRVDRIEDKVRPVAMLGGPASGQNRRDTSRAVTKHRFQTPAMGG